MALDTYRKKRNFRATPEPRGKVTPRKSGALSFVIQKHAASHLHYDFRLELNGVLLSWAVPKGPSLDPAEKRLAIQVEDHPLDYGGFEGVIPAGEYGGGTVMVWDRGTWVPKGDPVAGYADGALKFELQGEKLHGGWTLVRTSGSKYGGKSGKAAWLLIKERDGFAKRGPAAHIVDDAPESALSGRAMDEIARDQDRVWHSNKSGGANVRATKSARTSRTRNKSVKVDPSDVEGAKRARLPAAMVPMLATLVKAVPLGDEWLHEIKQDGYRMLCRVDHGTVRVFARSGREWTGNLPTIVEAVERLPVDTAWIDGELTVVLPDGHTSFQALQNALSDPSAGALTYFVFDLPYLDGYDLRDAALLERKRLLERILVSAPTTLRYSEHVQGSGSEFLAQACKLGLEGAVSKRADSTYQGTRGRDWVKVKCAHRQEMVIGGFTDPQRGRVGLGALLLGVYESDGSLRYSGKVGTGFDEKTLLALRKQLDRLVQDKAAFSNPPKGYAARGAHWVKPQLVAEVAFAEWTADGTLRQAAFQGLRADKEATEVVRERPQALAAATKPASRKRVPAARKAPAPARTSKQAPVAVAGVALSNSDKLLYPDANITKLDLARYYEAIGEWIVPHVEDRPLSLVRCPDGWKGECFYQKHADKSVNAAVSRVRVPESSGSATYLMADSVAALVGLVQWGVLELHPWGSRTPKLDRPDQLIFDFDPDDAVGWGEITEAVGLLRTLLNEIGLIAFLKTTGGKGLHVVTPIKPTLDWVRAKAFTKSIADLLVATFPDRFTATLSKSSRKGKIFIDYLRNAEGATAVCAYSPRSRANAPVSTPIAWEELRDDLRFDHFNVRNIPGRLGKLKSDPWRDFFAVEQTVTAAMVKRVSKQSPSS
jgi:bifunctional non-homologous end joining protein LigD